jgi:hypothetical protein
MQYCKSDMDNGWIGTEFIERFTSTSEKYEDTWLLYFK